MPEENLRLFVAFPLPEALWKDAETVRLRNEIATIRWTPLKNLHITIFFLGEVHSFNLDKIKEKIRSEVSASFPFRLQFEKISLQQGRKQSGMIWMKFLKDEKFSSLSKQLQHSLEEFLLHPAASHDMIPHVTLAHWKGHFDIEKFNAQPGLNFQLPEINFCELWQSVNSVDGVKYISLERFVFSN